MYTVGTLWSQCTCVQLGYTRGDKQVCTLCSPVCSRWKGINFVCMRDRQKTASPNVFLFPSHLHLHTVQRRIDATSLMHILVIHIVWNTLCGKQNKWQWQMFLMTIYNIFALLYLLLVPYLLCFVCVVLSNLPLLPSFVDSFFIHSCILRLNTHLVTLCLFFIFFFFTHSRQTFKKRVIMWSKFNVIFIIFRMNGDFHLFFEWNLLMAWYGLIYFGIFSFFSLRIFFVLWLLWHDKLFVVSIIVIFWALLLWSLLSLQNSHHRWLLCVCLFCVILLWLWFECEVCTKTNFKFWIP